MSNTQKEMSEWFDGKKINEILFCEAFRKEHPMICINGRFFTVDGLIADPGKLESEIFNTIKYFVTEKVSNLAKKAISASAVIADLKKKLEAARQDTRIWKERYEALQTQTKDFLAALKKAPEAVKTFLSRILHMEKSKPEQEIQQRSNTLVK